MCVARRCSRQAFIIVSHPASSLPTDLFTMGKYNYNLDGADGALPTPCRQARSPPRTVNQAAAASARHPERPRATRLTRYSIMYVSSCLFCFRRQIARHGAARALQAHARNHAGHPGHEAGQGQEVPGQRDRVSCAHKRRPTAAQLRQLVFKCVCFSFCFRWLLLREVGSGESYCSRADAAV